MLTLRSLMRCGKIFINGRQVNTFSGKSDQPKWAMAMVVNLPNTCVPSAGLKRHANVHRRCPDCRIHRIGFRLANTCRTHPRHNQLQYYRDTKAVKRPYIWRWPDPFDIDYTNTTFEWNRYTGTFKT